MLAALTASIVAMALALVWLALEVRKANETLGPIARSNIVQTLSRV